MLFLFLAIFSSFLIGNVLKLADVRGVSTPVIIASNYIFATILGLVWLWQDGGTSVSSFTILMGIGGGILWPGSFLVYVWGIAKFGIALTGPLARLALIVPVLFGLIFLQEPLTVLLGIGLLLTLAAFYFLSPTIEKLGDENSQQPVSSLSFWLYAPMLLLAFGSVLVWSNLFTTFGNVAENNLFLLGIYGWSIPFAWAYVWWEKERVTISAVFLGLLVGIPNFLSTYAILKALQHETFIGSSVIVYTIQGGANALLIFLAGAFFWQESVSKWNYLGLLFSIAAIVCLNL